MHQRPTPPPPLIDPAVIARLRKPQVFVPIAIVAGIILLAFVVQPGGAQGQTQTLARPATPTVAAPSPSTTPVVVPTVATRATSAAQSRATSATVPAFAASSTPGQTNTAGAPSALAPATDQVAGVRATPDAAASAAASPSPDLVQQSAQCGTIQEVSTPVSIQQVINGVSVQAQRVATYPVEYFRCILMATGGQEADALAQAVGKAQTAGKTTIVLIDLWITDAGQDFGQVGLKSASLAAAGQSFNPIATLGGRADVVVSSGQGRNVTLVVAIRNTVGATTGPMTLTINAPIFGGTQVAGKYQLFLPTP